MTPDRRRLERVPSFTALTPTLLPGGHSIEGRTIDIGFGGVGLICPGALAPGSFVSPAFRLRHRSDGEVLEPLVDRTTHARSDEAGTTIVVRFLTPPEERSSPVLFRMSGQL